MIGLFVTGLLLLAVAQLSDWASAWAGRALSDRVQSSIAALFDPDGASERRSLFVVDEQGRPDSAALDDFVSTAIHRYGPLEHTSIIQLSPRTSDLELVAAATLHFQRAQVLSTVRLQLIPGSSNEMALMGLELLDRDRGDLAVGDLGGETRPVVNDAAAHHPDDAPPGSAATHREPSAP